MAFSSKKLGRKYVPGVTGSLVHSLKSFFLSDHKVSCVRCCNANMNKQQSLTLSFLLSTKVPSRRIPNGSSWPGRHLREVFLVVGKDHKWTSEEGKGILERARMGFEMRDMRA